MVHAMKPILGPELRDETYLVKTGSTTHCHKLRAASPWLNRETDDDEIQAFQRERRLRIWFLLAVVVLLVAGVLAMHLVFGAPGT